MLTRSCTRGCQTKMNADDANGSSGSGGQPTSSLSAVAASIPPAAPAASVSSTPFPTPVFQSSSDRASFFAAKNAARAARKREKHARAQVAQTEAHQRKLADERLEALEWCRTHLQISEQAQAARSASVCHRRRCIVLMQFSGTRYKGMQLQNRQNKDSTKSIEGEMLHALYRSGAIDESMQSVRQIRWQRTARTDAGVHAAFNVFSCILLYDEGLLERLRSEMPTDIAVLSILNIAEFDSAESSAAAPSPQARSVSSSASAASAASASAAASSSSCVAVAAPPSSLRFHPFHAKDSCTGRLYEYILPSAMWGEEFLIPPKPVPKDAGVVPLDSPAASSPIVNASPPAGSAEATSPAAAATAGDASASPSTSKPTPASRLPYTVPSLPPSSSGSASFDFEPFAQARLDVPATIPKLNALLSRFVGTKSFHNFGTPAATGGAMKKQDEKGAGEEGASTPSSAASSRSGSLNRSPSSAAVASPFSSRRSTPRNPAQKTVFSFRVSESLLVVDGVEYCRVLVDGRSFILHQIRKMVGLAVMVARGMVDERIFESVFELGRCFDVPAIPARGLLLLRPYFAKYDAACDATQHPECSISRAFDTLQPRIGDFTRDVIEKEICQAHVSHAAYRAWIKSVQDEAKPKQKRG